MRIIGPALALLAVIVIGLAPASAAAAPEPTDYAARVVELTNAERAAAGLSPLTLEPQLTQAAQSYAGVLAGGDCFAHTCGPVPDVADRLAQVGYTGWQAIGENIAAGYPTPEAVVAGWMASPPHRANMLSPSYTQMGVGFVHGGGGYGTYWAADFGDSAQQTSPGDQE